MDILRNFIDGRYQKPVNLNYIDNTEPATGLVYGQIPNSDQADVDLAVDSTVGWDVVSDDRLDSAFLGLDSTF